MRASHPHWLATEVRIITSKRSNTTYRDIFAAVWNAPLPNTSINERCKSAASAQDLRPDHFRRGSARPVSCYALFKWWLLLSQHPGFALPHPFTLSPDFGTLAGGLGCFPLEKQAYPHLSDSRDSRHGIRSLVGQGSLVDPQNPFSLSTPTA